MILPLLLASATPSPVAPTGPWIVSVEENMCLLERHYPAARDQTSLVFQPLLDLPTMELFIATADGYDNQHVGTFKVRVEPGARTFTGHYFSAHVPTTTRRLTRLTIDRVMLDGLRDGDTLFVQAKPINAGFSIVRPEKARPALDGCIADLKKSWGIDPDRDARAVTTLDGNPARYFGPNAYPKEALDKGIYGKVIALLNITPEGTVENCRIVSSAGRLLNEGTCTAARRIRFKPPLDAQGKPLASTYLLPVRCHLPGAPD